MSQEPLLDNKKTRKRSKKKMLLILLILLVALGPWAIIVPLAYREITRSVTVQNPDGATGTAFIVVRPGVSSLPDQVASKVAAGLLNQGWRVETTTPSSATPTDITPYDLVVLISPVYGAHPHKTLLDYLNRTNLQNMPVVLLLTSLGKQTLPMDMLKNATVMAGGRVVGEVLIGTFDGNGLDVAYQTGNNASLASA